ncbi:oligopeptide/dipeptide ABC transporter ATP-binding protein [Streptomyces himastatinicus]|nr:ABC transporter ATP-binding protein [Streptomyces himastatinicus]
MTAPAAAECAPHPTARPPLVTVEDLVKHFPLKGGAFGRKQRVHSVEHISFTIAPGEVLGLVGESGCGKSTLARAMLGLTPIDSGRVLFDGIDVAGTKGRGRKALRRSMQRVFQDPFAALDPRMRRGTSLDAPLAQHCLGPREERHERILQVLGQVGLDASFLDRRPGECSGGQLQRVVVARALLLRPRLLICDEPTSALDASVHVVRHVCDRVAVMYLGESVEVASREDLFERPAHPYTQALLTASLPEAPGAETGLGAPRGEPPSPVDPPSGCRFHPRCPKARDRCRAEAPALDAIPPGRTVACHYPSA